MLKLKQKDGDRNMENLINKDVLINNDDTLKTMNKDIWIISESTFGIINDETYELISKGRELADKLDGNLVVIYIGTKYDKNAEKISKFLVDKSIIIPINSNLIITNDIYSDIYIKLVSLYKPRLIMFSASIKGKETSAYISAKMSIGLVADCTNITVNNESDIIYSRPAFSESIMANIKCKNSKTEMCTVRKNVFKKSENNITNYVKLQYFNYDRIQSENLIIKEIRNISTNEGEILEKADLVVIGGRGVGEKNFELLKKFANNIGAVIGGTRGAVEEGWIDKKYQIGQSGLTISPKICITFGVSGAIQHIAGILSSKTIIAINSDKESTIFKYADYKIVANIEELLPILLNENTNYVTPI